MANAGSADQVGAAARRTAGVGDRLRAAVHAVPGADAKVGGEPAATHDIAIASKHDRTWVPLLVPMLAIDLGERFWWPGRPSARRRPAHRAPAEV